MGNLMYIINWLGIIIISIFFGLSVPDEYALVVGKLMLVLFIQAFLSYAFLEQKEINENDETK